MAYRYEKENNMKNLSEILLEKLVLKDNGEKLKHLSEVVPGVNFEDPTDEDCKKLEDAFRKAGVLPTVSRLDSRYHTYNYWFVGISRGGIALKANITFSKPYKKKETYNRAYIEFSQDDDSFIAGNSGGVFYKYESPEAWEKVIMPIADFFGAKFNKAGEFLMPGASSHWND